jgi:Alkylmercury lyase/Helix-turn-helix domain of alkylmercury lyase
MSASVFESLKKALLEPETAFEWKLFHRLWQMLVESTTPVSLDALAQALHTSRERVKAVLERYPDAEYNQFGNLLGWGLTLHPTIHQLVVEGYSLYAWCAPDTLYDPLVLNRSAKIVSQCPVTGAKIEILLTPDRLESLSPASAVVSIVRDGSVFTRLQEAGCIQQGAVTASSSSLPSRSPHHGPPSTQTSSSCQLKRLLRACGISPCSKWSWSHVHEEES